MSRSTDIPLTSNQIDKVLKRVGARIPASVTPATRIEIHPSEWIELANEVADLRERLDHETAALTSDQQLPDKADLLGMAACVQRVARDNQWSNTAEVLYKAARLLEQLAESSPVETPALTPIEQLLVEWWGGDMDNAELFNRVVRLSPPLAAAMTALPEKANALQCPRGHTEADGECSSTCFAEKPPRLEPIHAVTGDPTSPIIGHREIK